MRQRRIREPRYATTSLGLFCWMWRNRTEQPIKTPWPGDPRANIQDDKGNAKAYQVRQVLWAIGKLKELKRER
jgi:hypothetical protein